MVPDENASALDVAQRHAWLSALAVDDFVRATTAIVALAFVSGLLVDGGYFFALGLDFSLVPVSLMDHTLSCLNWLPASAFGLLLGVFSWGPPTLAAVTPSRERKRPALRWRLVALFAALILATAAAWWLLGSFIFVSVVGGACLAWCFISSRRSKTIFGFAVRAFVPVFLALFALGFGMGAVNATNPQAIATIESPRAQPREVALIRTLEHGILYTEERHVGFIRWESVTSISGINSHASLRLGFICHLIACAPPERPAAPAPTERRNP